MKKSFIVSLLIALTLALDVSPGMANAALPAASVTVTDAQLQPGEAILSLTVGAVEGGTISLLDPRFNGEPAGFDRGDPDVQLDVLEDGGLDADVVIRSYDDDETCDSISFRVAGGGAILGTVCIQSSDKGWQVAESSPRSPLIVTEAAGPEAYPEPFRLGDTLPAERAALLDYGQAVVCLRQEDGSFLPVCVLPAEVSDDGAVSASYSGLVLTLDDDSDVLFSLKESLGADGVVWESALNTLTGEAIEYAEMTLALCRDPEGFRVTGQSFDAWETGGVCDFAPYDLFDTLLITQPLYAFEEKDGRTTLRQTGSRARRVDIDGPMSLRFQATEELGDVWVYFEFFFTDQTDDVHMPFPLVTMEEVVP
ncbi:MAG: hypothetical protein IJJ23_02260 [Clostridia bacterium]|nr:hypothetical protein [Clostridia bacterium]